jgi:hypothetical protein
MACVRALPDHSLLDRIVRGRVWIPLLGVLLAGIVAMQVEVLKLGASMGLSIQRGTALQSRNEILRANVASLTDETRIEQRAAAMGMVMPLPGEATFLTVGGRADVQRAINNIHAPDATAFAAALQATELTLGATAPAAASTTTSTGGASATTSTGGAASGSSAVTPAVTGVPTQTGASAPPAGTGVPTSGQTNSTGGASPTGG